MIAITPLMYWLMNKIKNIANAARSVLKTRSSKQRKSLIWFKKAMVKIIATKLMTYKINEMMSTMIKPPSREYDVYKA